jgi:putative ABC transport system permease protein
MIVALSALLPLEKVKVISVASLYREGFETKRIQPKTLILFSAFLILFFLSLLFSADNKLIVTAFFGALAVIVAFIFALIWLVTKLAGKIESNNLTAKFILKGLKSNPSPSKSLLLTLSLGLSLMTALFFVEDTIKKQIGETKLGDTPAFFFVDIPNREDGVFEALVKARKGDVTFNKVASLRGRLTHLNGVEADKTSVSPSVKWIFNGDRGITYATQPPQGSVITQGEYWAANYEGKNLVSIEEKLANDLNLKIGDTLSVLVLGRKIDAEISNFRKVNWQSFGINFFLVFSPSTFKGAPHTWLMTLSSPTMTFADEMAIMGDVNAKYPSITAIRVKETLEMIEDLTGKIAFALQSLSLLTLLTSLFVLAGALSSSQQARLKEITLLKVLGGKQGLILKLNALNFAFLGLLSVVIALVAGSVLAFAISYFALKALPSIAVTSASLLLVIALGVTLVLGLYGTFKALRTKPSVVLRNL